VLLYPLPQDVEALDHKNFQLTASDDPVAIQNYCYKRLFWYLTRLFQQPSLVSIEWQFKMHQDYVVTSIDQSLDDDDKRNLDYFAVQKIGILAIDVTPLFDSRLKIATKDLQGWVREKQSGNISPDYYRRHRSTKRKGKNKRARDNPNNTSP
jgi:hypothetical protein